MLNLDSTLEELELKLLRQEVRRSPEDLSRLLAEEFQEFGSSGRVFDKADIIASLQNESRSRFSVSDFRVQKVSADVALVTYRAVRSDEGDHMQVTSLRSSLWVFRDGRWQVLFHQGTKVGWCVAAVDSEEETRRNFQDALITRFDAMREVGEPVPEPHASVDYVEVAGLSWT